MGGAGRITRRGFLIGSAAIVGGGVAFGVYLARRPIENPLLGALGPGDATFNPWVIVRASGITLITPHVDLGQGAVSMQALLIAEEMDLDAGQFDTSFGVPAQAYYNTAVGDDVVPFLSTNHGAAAEAVRATVRGVFKVIHLQITGGSSAVPDSFEKLRAAGAVARETLKAAAAAQTGIDVSKLTTKNAAVILPDGHRLPYVELAAVAAGLDPVQVVRLRDRGEWRLIGKPNKRLDIVSKSTGTQDYGIDVSVDGMLHGTLRCNPRKSGAPTNVDTTAARAMRGVHSIVPVTDGFAVLADNTWRAFRAADEIKCDWGPAHFPAEQSDHWSAVAAAFDDPLRTIRWRNQGDVSGHLAGTRDVVRAEYRAPYVAHQPLEPLSATVHVGENRVDIWISHQVPGFAVAAVAKAVGVDVGAVHIHNQYAGGSFGHRFELDFVLRAAEAAAQVRGTAVKITLSREEDFMQDHPRQISMARGQGSVNGGKVEALDLGIAAPSVTQSLTGRFAIRVPGPDKEIVAGAWNMPYDLPHLRVRAHRVKELAPISYWRSVGASTAGFFAESFLDELIHAAGADPMEERLRLCNDHVARKVLEAVAEMSAWGGDPGPNRGRGVALVRSFGVPVAQVVDVTMTDAGLKIDTVFVAADVGRVVDPVNFENQVQGGVIWGLGHAINSQITYSDGMAEQSNYHAAEGMRLYQTPRIVVRGLENAEVIRGIGEPPVPPAAPALANAIFAATGKRLREMPFDTHLDFF